MFRIMNIDLSIERSISGGYFSPFCCLLPAVLIFSASNYFAQSY
jgi:hypothetical protein